MPININDIKIGIIHSAIENPKRVHSISEQFPVAKNNCGIDCANELFSNIYSYPGPHEAYGSGNLCIYICLPAAINPDNAVAK